MAYSRAPRKDSARWTEIVTSSYGVKYSTASPTTWSCRFSPTGRSATTGTYKKVYQAAAVAYGITAKRKQNQNKFVNSSGESRHARRNDRIPNRTPQMKATYNYFYNDELLRSQSIAISVDLQRFRDCFKINQTVKLLVDIFFNNYLIQSRQIVDMPNRYIAHNSY